MTQTLTDKHPSLADTLAHNPSIRTYTVRNINGKITEYWCKDDQGVWHNHTEQILLEQEIAAAQEELARLANKEATHG